MPDKILRILHTSDWHIGKKLYNMDRYDEFEAFFEWLLETVQREAIDILLVCGDIFDTGAPSSMAQGIYYRFLWNLTRTACRHVVVTAGNHDSPAFLEAPRDLLNALNIHVLGAISGNPADEALLLQDREKNPEAIICATPYLRERDIRRTEAGESIQEKEEKIGAAIAAHYWDIAQAAAQMLSGIKFRVPVIAMGHLFVRGAISKPESGERNLYVGSLGEISADIFPDLFDYVALGHIHSAQKFGKNDHIRYCGSPLAMNFGEKKQKSVQILEWANDELAISELPVPAFRHFESVRGEWEDIRMRLKELMKLEKSGARTPWIEVVYDGGEGLVDNLARLVDDLTGSSGLKILCKRDLRKLEASHGERETAPSLEDIGVESIFLRCLERNPAIDAGEYGEYLQTFREIVDSLNIQDE